MRHDTHAPTARPGTVVALVAGVALSAAAAGFGSPAIPTVPRKSAELKMSVCKLQRGEPESAVGECLRSTTYTFSSACFSATRAVFSPLLGIVTPHGEQTIQSYQSNPAPLANGTFRDDGDFKTRNGVSVSWSGTKPGHYTGIGHGTWTASNLPRTCVTPGGSASGRFRSVWATTAQKATQTIMFYDFPR
jgi:hypothetical protein